jgi:GntR family transcriptional regulator
VSTYPIPENRRRRDASSAVHMRDLLRERILADDYPDGFLPGEHELMLEYSVGRATVREALAMLRVEGIIERRQGTGTFVQRRKVMHEFDRVHGIALAVSGRSIPEFLVEAVEAVVAPGPVAVTLGLRPGSRCARATFSARLDGEPFSISTGFLPPHLLPVLRPGRFEGDYYEYLESCGVPVVGGDLLVESVSADAWTASRLDLQFGAPVMFFRRRLYDADGNVVDLGFVRCRGDQLALAVRLPRHRRPSC